MQSYTCQNSVQWPLLFAPVVLAVLALVVLALVVLAVLALVVLALVVLAVVHHRRAAPQTVQDILLCLLVLWKREGIKPSVVTVRRSTLMK